jgi:hypothetical protein
MTGKKQKNNSYKTGIKLSLRKKGGKTYEKQPYQA